MCIECRKTLGNESGGDMRIHLTLLFGLFALICQLGMGEHTGNSRPGRPLPQSSASSASCIAELDAQQLQTLNQVKALTGQGLSDEELAQRTLRAIESSPMSENRRAALAAVAYGELTRAKRIEMQDPNGPMKENVQKLVRFGAKNTTQGLDLKGLDLNRLSEFKVDLQALFPESKNEIEKIDQDQNTPVILGNYVVLGKAGNDNTDRVLTVPEYQLSVRSYLEIIRAAFRGYQEDSNEATSTSNYLGAIFRRGPSDAERRADRSFNHLIRTINTLSSKYGFPENQTRALRDQVSRSLGQANGRIGDSLNQIYWMAGAIAAAPLAWPIVAIGGATAVAGIGTSLAFSAVDIVGTASINAIYGNGDLACNLGKQLLAKGPAAMVTALAFGAAGGALPRVARLSSEAVRKLAGSRALALAGRAAQGVLMAPGLIHTGAAFFSASDLDVLAEAAEKEGEPELANEYRRLATQAKFSGAQGLASSVVLPIAARYMSQSFTFNQQLAQRLLGKPLTGPMKRAIERAHRVGDGQLGRDGRTPASVNNYTRRQLVDKKNILEEAGFSRDEIRALMREGVVGRGNDFTRAYENGDEIEAGGRTTQGTLNNRGGGQTAAQQVQAVATRLRLSADQQHTFGASIHAVKADPHCPPSWLTSTGDLTFQALEKIARFVKAGSAISYE